MYPCYKRNLLLPVLFGEKGVKFIFFSALYIRLPQDKQTVNLNKPMFPLNLKQIKKQVLK